MNKDFYCKIKGKSNALLENALNGFSKTCKAWYLICVCVRAYIKVYVRVRVYLRVWSHPKNQSIDNIKL